MSALWHFYRYSKKRNSVLVSVFHSPSELLYKYVYHSFADGGLIPERSLSHQIWCGSTAQCSYVKLPFHPLSTGFLEIWGRHIYLSVLLFSLWYIFMDFIHSPCLGFSRYYISCDIMVVSYAKIFKDHTFGAVQYSTSLERAFIYCCLFSTSSLQALWWTVLRPTKGNQ